MTFSSPVTPKTSRDLSALGGSPLGQVLTEVHTPEWKTFFDQYLQFNGDKERITDDWLISFLIASIDLVKEAQDDDPEKFLPQLFKRANGDKLKKMISNSPRASNYEDVL